MRDDDLFEDIDLGEEDFPLVEIELDEEGEGGSGGKGKTALKIALIVVLILALAAAGFFLVRFILGAPLPRNDSTTAILTEPVEDAEDDTDIDMDMETPSDMEEDADLPAEDDMAVEDDGEAVDTELTEEAGATAEMPEVVPIPVETPAPTPAVAAIPEQYMIPGVETGDLTAVHAYIQERLNEMAADPGFPNVDEITANEDCTVFTVICTSLNESAAERAAAEDFYEFGRMYAAHAGTEAGNIHIDYKNHNGGLLWTRDSNG